MLSSRLSVTLPAIASATRLVFRAGSAPPDNQCYICFNQTAWAMSKGESECKVRRKSHRIQPFGSLV